MIYPENCDERVKKFVDELSGETREALGDQLVSTILHGSLAMGCYYFPKSDIDLLIVTDSALSPVARKDYFSRILQVSNRRPMVGDVELSVVQRNALECPTDCIPYEVHFGEQLKGSFATFDFSENRCDFDLPAHFMTAYHRGVSLFGPPLDKLMSEPSWEAFRASVRGDLDWILEAENILTTPFYSILNCCRAYQVLVKRQNQIFSKEEGAKLALREFPTLARVIQAALDAYQSQKEVTADTRRHNGQIWDKEELLHFRDTFRGLLSSSRSTARAEP